MKASLLNRRKHTGFSLIELLVSVAVLSLVMVLVFQMLEKTQITFKKARDSVSEYKDARNGFDAITRRVSQATLNTFWHVTKNSSGVATKFERESDLHFVSGRTADVMGGAPANAGERVTQCLFFQAPTGYTETISTNSNSANTLKYGNFSNLLNAWGYFIEFGDDRVDRPAYLNALDNAPKPRVRYRLMEYSQVTEGLQVYADQLRAKQIGQSPAVLNRWFLNESRYGVNSPNNYGVATSDQEQAGLNRSTRMIAENIIALLVLPADSLAVEYRDKLAPNYYYDTRAWQSSNSGKAGGAVNLQKTRHVLPPIIDITMVAVDEADFRRVAQINGIDSISGFGSVDFTKGLFENASNYDKDLATLGRSLSERTPPIKFRTFRASVRLREAKWGGFVDADGSN